MASIPCRPARKLFTSRRSAFTISTPAGSMALAFSGERASARTWKPSASSIATGAPRRPVAPTTAIFRIGRMVSPGRFER